jgi:lactam utilization protein B
LNKHPAAPSPAPMGNRRAVRHGGYVTKLTESENAEIAALADELRETVPVQSPSVEPAVQTLAGLIWRQRKLLTFLDEHGLTRGRSDQAQLQPAVEVLAVVDRQIITTMASLAMLPKQAADLGLTLKRLEAQRRYDRSRLTPAERRQLDALIAKTETYEGDWPDAS